MTMTTIMAPPPPRRPSRPSAPSPFPSLLRRPRLRHAALALLAVAAFLHAEYGTTYSSPDDGRRELAYLDPKKPAFQQMYGRTSIDQNFQSLLRPSWIDSSLFRKKDQKVNGASKGYTEETACDDIFLFVPQSFAHNGHGSQLNNYLLAAMVATFSNRAMVLLEPPPKDNVFKSNSQFGCPPEAWETKRFRTGAPPKRIGWNKDFPNGLDRLIRHPKWLSRGCPVPCQGEQDYESWDNLRLENYNATEVPVPREVTCRNPTDDSRTQNVIVMGGVEVRDYFDKYYKEKMSDRSQPPSIPAAEWALRLGAAPHEARVFSNLREKKDVWDYSSAMVTRSGILRFQPWIARDVEEYVRRTDLPLDAPYDAMHVRRGDKLFSDAKRFVIRHWQLQKLWDEEKEEGPTNYIPFSHYLAQYETVPCSDDVRTVYVATDDPKVVRAEIEELPKDEEGHTLSEANEDGCRHRFKFLLGLSESTSGFHIDEGKSKGDCEERYARNVAGVADMMILARSDVFVGEFNSNWGRLIRTFRLRMNDSMKIMNGARPVHQKEMRVAWGQKRPGPPGW